MLLTSVDISMYPWLQDTGAPLWMHSSEKPFFSSPQCCHSYVCIGSVDGNLYGLSHAGEKVREIIPAYCEFLKHSDELAVFKKTEHRV